MPIRSGVDPCMEAACIIILDCIPPYYLNFQQGKASPLAVIFWLVAPSIGQVEKPCPTHEHLREYPGTTDDTVCLLENHSL